MKERKEKKEWKEGMGRKKKKLKTKKNKNKNNGRFEIGPALRSHSRSKISMRQSERRSSRP